MELIELSTQTLLLLFMVAVLAGFCDTLAGGGGLLVLPALIAAGVPPLQALATNKLQSTAGTATASSLMFVHKKVNPVVVIPLMLLAFVGSAIGSLLVLLVDQSVLLMLVPVVLVLIAVYFIVSPSVNTKRDNSLWMQALYKRFAVPTIGWYDGFLGPGTGSFFVLAGVSLTGQAVVPATMQAKTLNFASNLASLCVFLWAGQILWLLGLVMMAGQLIGAYAGSRCLLCIHPNIVRWLVVVLSLSMLTHYLWTQFLR